MIPVIDCMNDVLAHSTDIYEALVNVGFVYLRNFGFPYENAVRVQDRFKHEFWPLDESTKLKYKRDGDFASGGNCGYLPPNAEVLQVAKNGESIIEVKETYNITPCEKSVNCILSFFLN